MASDLVAPQGHAMEHEIAMERRVRQIRELVRLSSTLHADLGLAEILTQLANAVSSTIGFGVAAFNLVREDDDHLEIAAAVGLSASNLEQLRVSPPALSELRRVMQPRFLLSRSYYIDHEHLHVLDGIATVAVAPPPPPGTPTPPDAWHPDDMLLVPLVSARHDRLLGILSLDQPEDGKVPSRETIEVVELFASQAAMAIDMARLFAERERERRSLEASVYTLLHQMGEVDQGNLAVRAELAGTALGPLGDLLKAALSRLEGLLGEVRRASEMLSLSAGAVHDAATQMAQSAQHQAQEIASVSAAVMGIAAGVTHISATAGDASTVAQEAIETSQMGREAAERAAAGMAGVRELTLQSARKIKRLGESTQEIGEIVQLVAEFAERTHLLALNAAIEATRAGEHGHGFALIAKEIRNLATSSGEATQAVHDRIQAIQHNTHAVVVAIEEGTRQVVVQSDLASRAGAALGAVDAVTQRIAQAIGDITRTAGEQAETSTRIAGSMEEIARITAHGRDSMEQMRRSMEQLAELAQSLLRSIGVFRLGPASAVEAPPAPDDRAAPAAGADDPAGSLEPRRQTTLAPPAVTRPLEPGISRERD